MPCPLVRKVPVRQESSSFFATSKSARLRTESPSEAIPTIEPNPANCFARSPCTCGPCTAVPRETHGTRRFHHVEKGGYHETAFERMTLTSRNNHEAISHMTRASLRRERQRFSNKNQIKSDHGCPSWCEIDQHALITARRIVAVGGIDYPSKILIQLTVRITVSCCSALLVLQPLNAAIGSVWCGVQAEGVSASIVHSLPRSHVPPLTVRPRLSTSVMLLNTIKRFMCCT